MGLCEGVSAIGTNGSSLRNREFVMSCVDSNWDPEKPNNIEEIEEELEAELERLELNFHITDFAEEDVFGEIHRMLGELSEVTELHPVPDAHVPVLGFKFNGVSIDLLYGELSLWVIPERRTIIGAETWMSQEQKAFIFHSVTYTTLRFRIRIESS